MLLVRRGHRATWQRHGVSGDGGRKCLGSVNARPLKGQVGVARRRARGGVGGGRPARMPRHRHRRRGQLAHHNVGARPWRSRRIGAGDGGEDGRLQRVHRSLLRPAGEGGEDLADRDLLPASLGDRVGSDRGRILGSGAACGSHELVRGAMRGAEWRAVGRERSGGLALGGGTLFGEEEGSGDWRRPVGIVSLGTLCTPGHSIRYTPKAFYKRKIRSFPRAGKRTAASGVAWEELLEARTQASVAFFKLGAHSAALRPEFGGP